MAREFLAVGNFLAREFLAEVFGGFWDFWRLGIFGVFGGLVVLRVSESMLGHRCLAIDVGTSTFEAVMVVWFGIGLFDQYLSIQRLNVIT